MFFPTSHDEETQQLLDKDDITAPGRTISRTIWATVAPAALWYSLFLVSSLLIPGGEAVDTVHWQWLLLNMGLSGFIYWAVAQLLLSVQKSWTTMLAILLLAMGGASTTCRLAITVFYPRGGNPCSFFPGAYYDPLAEANHLTVHSPYYNLEETQGCQNWVSITHVSAFLWAGLIAPCVVGCLQQQSQSTQHVPIGLPQQKEDE